MVLESEIEALKGVLKKTFSNIKTDISVNSKEIEILRKYNRDLEIKVLQLESQLKNISVLIEKQNSSNEQINNKEINQNISNTNTEVLSRLEKIEGKLNQQSSRVSEKGLTAQIIRKVDRNRKSIIKNKIINLVSVQELTLPELKDILVNDQNLCSKATFYRYFEELKKKGILTIISINDSNIIVINKQIETSLR